MPRTRSRINNLAYVRNVFTTRGIYLIAILGYISTIPQLTKIYLGRQAAGVSAFAWSAYSFFAICWMIYGIARRDKAIIINNLIWALLNGFVALGAILYG